MILDLANVLLIIVLLFVLYFDAKQRAIHIILPLLIFGLSIVINYASHNLEFLNIVHNTLFLGINMFGLMLYFSLKNKRLFNPIDTVIGLGDIVFLVAITPLFQLKTYILFFIAGLLFSLVIHITTQWFKKVQTIPLAGYLSLFLVIAIVIKNGFNINMTF